MVGKIYLVDTQQTNDRRFAFAYLDKNQALMAATFFNAPDNEEDVPRKVWALDLDAVPDEAFVEVDPYE